MNNIIYSQELNVKFNNHDYHVMLDFTHHDSDVVKGHLEVTNHNSGFDFYWKRDNFAEPYVSNVTGKGDWRAAKVFAKAALTLFRLNLISDNGDGQTPCTVSRDEYYISKLLVEGHIRRPAWVHTRDGQRTFLRRGTVVNAAKLPPHELEQAKKAVDFMNSVAEEFGDPISFGEWLEKRAQ